MISSFDASTDIRSDGRYPRPTADAFEEDHPRAQAAYGEKPSLAEMIKDIRDDALLLMKQELALAKKEMSRDAKKAGKRAGKAIGFGLAAAIGAGLVLLALCFAVGGLFALLGVPNLFAAAIGFLLVGGLMAAVFGLLAKKAIDKLQKVDPTPHRTLQTLTDPAAARRETKPVTKDHHQNLAKEPVHA